MNLQVKRKVAREQAMPAVKSLVKKHGRTTVQGCLNQLREYEVNLKRLNEAQKEVERLEKQVN